MVEKREPGYYPYAPEGQRVVLSQAELRAMYRPEPRVSPEITPETSTWLSAHLRKMREEEEAKDAEQ